MRSWSRRSQVGIIDHILRQYPFCRSCSICPLQCLNLFHKLLNQRALRIRLQHGEEKQQGWGGGDISPAFQVAVCAAGNTKLLCHGFLRQRLLLPQGIQFLGEKLCEQRWVGFIRKTSIVKLTMEILCRNEVHFHEARFMPPVQSL